ncbi:MAG: DNA polymerase III, delta subunit, partial [Streptococcus anginosus DORA_7]
PGAPIGSPERGLIRISPRGRQMSPRDLGMAPWQVDRARRELAGWSEDEIVIELFTRGDKEKLSSFFINPTYFIELSFI